MTANTELIWNDAAYARIKGGISSVDTEIEVYPGDVQLFLPLWEAGKEFEATITDSQGHIEIVVVTDIDPNKFTVERGAGSREWEDGAIINQRITANLMTAMIQKEAERQVAYNPNGVLTAVYRGEKVFQSDQKIWWKNVSGTVWQCIAGTYTPPPELEIELVSVATYDNLACVTWSPELGLFCALSGYNTGRSLISVDGITWDNYAVNNYTWYDICWSPTLNLFCATGYWSGSKVMTSPDGVNWSGRTPQNHRMKAICWSEDLELFCGVSNYQGDSTAAIQTSPDGINWTSRTTPADHSCEDIIWCPDLSLFIAVGIDAYNGGMVMTSPDGMDWTSHLTEGGLDWTGIAYSPELGILVAVSAYAGGARLMTSLDGVNWTLRDNLTGYYSKVEWSPEIEKFIAVPASPTTTIAYSDDGITWNEDIDSERTGYTGIAYSPTLETICATRFPDETGTEDFCLITEGS